MKFLLAQKKAMTQVFDDAGRVRPATVVAVCPLTLDRQKSADRDGYTALVFRYQAPGQKMVRRKEYRLASGATSELELGATVAADAFAAGDEVTVSGISKGKGFQGVVKRHGFKGGRRSHGQKHSEREPGSIGGGGRAGGRVAKGMRMAGRMGSDRVTVPGLTVLAVDPGRNEMVLSGAIPGRRGTIVEIRG